VDIDVQNCNIASPEITKFTRGNKSYELSTTVTLTLNIATGKKVRIKSFSFYNRVSNSGYRHWKMYISGIEVGDSSLYYPATGSTGNNTVKSTGTVPVKNVVEDLTGSITVLLKLYDHDAAYPNGNAQGTFRMDDFVLNGYINDDGGISGSGYQYANKGGYRYGFNGQEKSDEIKGEGNSYTAKFWEYDPRLGRRWNVDPKPTSGISEYSAFQNNPIYGIDVLGDTTYRFNKKDGSYIGMFDLNVGGQIGSYGSMKTIEKGKNKQEVWEGTNFEFADPANDSKDIRDGVINKLVFVSNEEIKALLTEKGAFNYADKNNPWRFYQNSKGGQNFDYSYSIIPDKYSAQGVSDQPLKRPSPLLFLPEGDYTAHNHMNFGNYLWGASGYTLGFNFATLQIGAHINSVKNPGTNGYPRQWDSPDDQNSIKKGAFHALQFKYRTILEVRHQAQIQQQGGYRK